MSVNVQEWLKFAQDDYDCAYDLLETFKNRYTGILAYHAQQAAEKALKAYLVSQAEVIFKTHDLVVLIRKCTDYDFSFLTIESFAAHLNPYSVQTRYPDDLCNDVSIVEAKKILHSAHTIIVFVKNKIA